MVEGTGTTLSHYRLLEQIGKGGTGVVWKAVDLELDREVALKLLSPGFDKDADRLRRFRDEARLLAALNHPNIVTVHSVEQAEEMCFITMEFVPGKSLKQLIPSNGMPLGEFYRLAVPMIDAMVAAHEGRIVHRDLKPANVIVGEDGRLRVLDFGLAMESRTWARSTNDDDSTETLEGNAGVSGTLHYMSPEQLRGSAADPRSDIFSLGVVMFEMLAGHRPFEGESPFDVIAAILRDSPAPLDRSNSNVPPRLQQLVGRCLEKDATRRIPSSRELLRGLETLRREAVSEDLESTPSIAVLPFTDMSATSDQEYFCDGLAEEIINALTRIQGLRVASRISSFQFRSSSLNSREIGDRLGVAALMEGSVRKAGQQLRVTAQVVSVSDGFHLWSKRFDREVEDVFAIQDEIAQSVVRALEVEMSPRERRAIKQVATDDVRAFDYYLRGRKYFNQYGRQGAEFALRMFTQAIESDANYALAYAGIADCHTFLFLHAERSENRRLQADLASRDALELDPELAEAHAARGGALCLADRFAEAKQSFDTALELNPNLFDVCFSYARESFIHGESDKATELYERAIRLRPDDYQSFLLMAQILADAGREDDARAARRRGIENAEKRLDLNPDDVRALYMGANGLVALGERQRGLEWADRARTIQPDEPMLLYNLACIYSLAEDVGRALECLEHSVANGFTHVGWIRNDSNLDFVRDHPRYRELLAGVTRPEEKPD